MIKRTGEANTGTEDGGTLCADTVPLVAVSVVRGDEKLVGTYSEVRTILPFELPEATVQKIVPSRLMGRPDDGGLRQRRESTS